MNFSFDIENKEEVIKWLNRIKSGTDDARPLWIAMESKIQEYIDYQFSDTSVNTLWKPLTTRYKTWKLKKGFPATIGVMTGTLKEGAGESAIKEMGPKVFVWKVNQSLNNPYSKKQLSEYAKYFNGVRSVYQNTAIRVNTFLATDIKDFNGGQRNSFTYFWLRNKLREHIK